MTEICSHTPTQYVLQFDRHNITLDPGNVAIRRISHRNKDNCTSYKYKGKTKPVKYTQNIEKIRQQKQAGISGNNAHFASTPMDRLG